MDYLQQEWMACGHFNGRLRDVSPLAEGFAGGVSVTTGKPYTFAVASVPSPGTEVLLTGWLPQDGLPTHLQPTAHARLAWILPLGSTPQLVVEACSGLSFASQGFHWGGLPANSDNRAQPPGLPTP